jgi:hypothetical protein
MLARQTQGTFGLGGTDNLQNSSLITECRKKVCDIMMIITDIKADQEIKIFLSRLRMLTAGNQDLKNLNKHNAARPTLPSKTKSKMTVEVLGPSEDEFSDKLKSMIIDSKLVEQLTQHTVQSNNSSIHLSKEKELVHLLVELVVTDDPSLQFSALRLLHSLYTQTSTLGRNVQKLQLVLTSEEKSELERGKLFAKELHKLVHSCELWFIESDVIHHQQLTSLLREALQKLKPSDGPKLGMLSEPEGEAWLIARTRQAGQSQSTSKQENKPGLKLCNLIVEANYSLPNKFFKGLCRNLGVISSLLHLLEFYQEAGQLEAEKPHYEPILLVMNLLWLLIKDSPENKHEFTPEIVKSVIFPYLKNEIQGIDFTAYFLLKDLFTDNDDVLVQDPAINLMCINQILMNMKELNKNDIRKSIYMDILSHIVAQKGSVSKQNQNLVIKRLFVDESSPFFIDLKSMEITIIEFLEALKRDKETFVSKIDNKVALFTPPTEISYLNSFVNVLTLCGNGKNAFSENIGQRYLPLSEVVKFLSIEGMHILTKLTFMNFCFHMYLDTEKEIMVFNYSQLLKIWNIYVEDLIDLSNEKEGKLFSQIQGYVLFTPDKIVSTEECLQTFAEILILSLENIINRKLLTAKKIYGQKNNDDIITACGKLQQSPIFKGLESHFQRLNTKVVSMSEDLREGHNNQPDFYVSRTNKQSNVIFAMLTLVEDAQRQW